MITSRRVSLISSSQPVKYVTLSSGKRRLLTPCRPVSVCAPSVLLQTPYCERRHVGMKRVRRHMPILRLLYSFNTDGGEAKSGERWSLAVSRPPALSSANRTESFQDRFGGFWKPCFALFISQIEIVLMKFVPQTFPQLIVKATCCQFVCVQTRVTWRQRIWVNCFFSLTKSRT